MSEKLVAAAERFVEHRRALGRKYISEDHELRLLARFAEAHGIRDLDQLTAVSLETFLGSRPRRRPRSFNHLLGVIRCFLIGPSSRRWCPARRSRSDGVE